MKKLAVIEKATNYVKNIILWDDENNPDPSIYNNELFYHEEYNEKIHPWNQNGNLEINIGYGWKNAVLDKPRLNPIIKEENK